MVDRFGPLPASADLLLLMMQIKVIARDLMIARVSMDASGALTLTIAGDREEAGEPVKNILAVSDREFEVKYEDSIVLRTALGATLPQQQAREIRALLLEIHTKHYNRENADASVAREQGKSPS
jgi:transcription-repair coupling factor (superfamily II helicase)